MTKEEAIERYKKLAGIYEEMMEDDCCEFDEVKPVYIEMGRLFDFINGLESKEK